MSQALQYALLSTIVVSLISLIGVISLSVNKRFLERILFLLISLSAGALLGDVFFHLLPELVHDQGGLTVTSSSMVLIGIVSFFILEKFLIWHHHHSVETPEDHEHHHHEHTRSIGKMNLVGDAFHNLLDGMIIAAGYLISPVVGVGTTIAVVLHEIPQEMGDFGVLIHSGYSVKKALFFNFLTALFAVLGAVVTVSIGAQSEVFLEYLIPLTAGAFIYIAGSDLIPELKKSQQGMRSFNQLMALIVGILMMYGLLFTGGHELQHADEGHDEIPQAHDTEASRYEVVAELDYPPVNVAVSADGRIFMSFQEGPVQVGELLESGELVAVSEGLELSTVFGLQIDADGVLWVLDAGSQDEAAQLISWDFLAEEMVERIPLLTELDKPLFFQDFALDQTHQMAYIADMGYALEGSQPALWKVDLQSGEMTVLMQNHETFIAEEDPLVINGKPFVATTALGEIDPDFGLNPITIDANDEWLSFGAMKGTKLYRIATDDLLNDDLREEDLVGRIEFVGEKPYSDGISVDDAGRIYVTDLEASGIGVVEPDGKYRLLFSDTELIKWPDGLSCGPDGWMYVTVNQNHLNAVYNGGIQEAVAPYHLLRFKALDHCRVGR